MHTLHPYACYMLLLLRPPPDRSTLFPYTTPFRSSELGKMYGTGLPFDDRSIEELEKAATLEPDHLDVQTELGRQFQLLDRKSTRLNSSHASISYAVFCSKKKTTTWLIQTHFNRVL